VLKISNYQGILVRQCRRSWECSSIT